MLKSSWEHCTRHDAPPAISHTEQHWHSEADAASCPIMMDSDREQKRHREAQCCQSPYVLKKNSTVAPMRCGSYEEWERVTQGCGRNAQKQMHDGSLNILVRQLWNNIWALGKWFFFFFFLFEAWRRGEVNSKKFYPCTLLGFKYDCSWIHSHSRCSPQSLSELWFGLCFETKIMNK